MRTDQQQLTLEEFAEQHGLTMRVASHITHDGSAKPIIFVRFVRVTVYDATDSTYRVFVGRGESEREALDAYAKMISGKRLLLEEPGEDRKMIDIPVLFTD